MSSVTVESVLQQIARLMLGDQERLRALHNGNDNLQEIGPLPPIKLANPIPEPDLAGAIEWLALNSEEYSGPWVALDGGRLIFHLDDHSEVADAAIADGAYLLLITFIEPKRERPSVRV